jgi:membrane-anchored glycerophosphoryl diester phosphodiesterase (GDPDase)
MLAFFAPNLIVALLLPEIVSPSAKFLVFLINALCVVPFVTGAAIFYMHQNLTQRGATLPDAMARAGEKFSQLILLTVIVGAILVLGFILLIIPGIYLSVRLSFVFYAVMIENQSAFNAIQRSWQLTQGHWWLLFWSFFLIAIVLTIPVVILTLLTASLDPAFGESTSAFLTFLISPLLTTYYVLLFMSFVNLTSLQNSGSS